MAAIHLNNMKNKIMNAYNILGDYYYKSRKEKSGISYFYNELLEMPTTLKMLGDVRDKRILDLGCGPGIYAKILDEKGARVKGIDISKELIRIAKKECPNGEFIVGSAEKLPYKKEEFDMVLAALVLDHIENWDLILKEVRRVLKKGGLFIFSEYNPITESLVKERWFFRKFKIIKNYFNEGQYKGKWKEPENEAEITHHHKTYSTIIKTLVRNNFEIIDYEDSYPIKEGKELFIKQYKEASALPKFCTWKLKKK